MDSKKIEIRPCPTYRSTGQDSCRRPDRVIVAEHQTANLDQMIAEAAYYKAEKRGFYPGHDLQDWLDAKREMIG